MEFKYDGHSLKSGIYKITNIYNNRFYYGSCKLFKVRWSQHKASLLRDKHQNKFLQADFNKCFEENNKNDDFLLFEVCEVVDGDKDLRLKIEEEKYLKPNFDNGKQCYNLINKASSPEGYVLKNPDETRKRRSVALKQFYKTNPDAIEKIIKRTTGQTYKNRKHKIYNTNLISSNKTKITKIDNLLEFCKNHKLSYSKMLSLLSSKLIYHKGWILEENINLLDKSGKINSIERYQKISLKLKGQKRSKETKEKMSKNKLGNKNPNFGKPLTKEHKEKISKSNSGKSMPKNTLNALINSRIVTYNIILVDPNGKNYGPITNLTKFCKIHNLERSLIIKVINNKRTHHKGWRILI